MKLYCFVENGLVLHGPTPLPTDISTLNDFELLARGWYYAECVRPDTFIDRYEVFLPIQFSVQPTKVQCMYLKRDKTQLELNIQNAEKQLEVEQDKINRLTLAETFMASDEYLSLSTDIQTQWELYIQVVTNTITEELGNAVWDVYFPSVPPMVNNS